MEHERKGKLSSAINVTNEIWRVVVTGTGGEKLLISFNAARRSDNPPIKLVYRKPTIKILMCKVLLLIFFIFF